MCIKLHVKRNRFIYAVHKRLEDIELACRHFRVHDLFAFNMFSLMAMRRLYTTENLRNRLFHTVTLIITFTIVYENRLDVHNKNSIMQWCIRFLLVLRPYFCQARELHADHSSLPKIFQRKKTHIDGMQEI